MNARMQILNDLVEEVTKDDFDVTKVQSLAKEVGIEYSEDHLVLLNNILKGIHTPGAKNGENTL